MFRNVVAPLYASVFSVLLRRILYVHLRLNPAEHPLKTTSTSTKRGDTIGAPTHSRLPRHPFCFWRCLSSVSCFMSLVGPLVAKILKTQPRGTLVLSATTSFLLAMSDICPKISSLKEMTSWEIKNRDGTVCILTSLDQHSGVWLKIFPHPRSDLYSTTKPQGFQSPCASDFQFVNPTSAVVVEQFTLEVSISCPAASKAFVRRGFDVSWIPSCLEPSVLVWGDGKRADGLTLIFQLFSDWKCLCSIPTLQTASFSRLYCSNDLWCHRRFTLAYRPIGKRAATLRRELRESDWFLQWIGLAIVKGKAITIRLSNWTLSPANLYHS